MLAIDGLAVRTRQPFKTEVKNIKSWCCRKGGWALIVMAGCDASGKFVMAIANNSGSTNDNIAWEMSGLYKAIEAGLLHPRCYFIIGDEAFSNTNELLSPWPGRGLGKYKDSFNYHLSHSRQVIEKGFWHANSKMRYMLEKISILT